MSIIVTPPTVTLFASVILPRIHSQLLLTGLIMPIGVYLVNWSSGNANLANRLIILSS